MILAFAQVEHTGQNGIAAGIGVDGRHWEVLREVNRLVRVMLRAHAEYHGQLIVGPGKFLERDADVIPGMEFKVEAQDGFDGGGSARNVLADFLRFQNGGVRGEQAHHAAGAGSRHQVLAESGPTEQEPTSKEVPNFHPTATVNKPRSHRHGFLASAIPSVPVYKPDYLTTYYGANFV